MARILVIDDDDAFREGLCDTITDLGHDPTAIHSADRAAPLILNGRYGGIFLDHRMPGKSGVDLLRELQNVPNKPPIVILTAYASSRNTIESMKLGAFDHLIKPVKRDQIAGALERMLGARTSGPEPVPVTPTNEESLIGVSDEIRVVEKLIGVASGSDTTVLLTGETGTGKEMVARALHDSGIRAGGPFVAINCAAIPTDLLESELFGHRRGAFTGAANDRVGSFQMASGGTLFLDEIGDMPAPMQAKILRVLQEKELTPVGAARPEKVNARVIAATHRNLREAAASGHFREDLFYRLNVFPIHLPALRERPDDILPLARHFLASGSSPKTLTPAAEKRLVDYAWPGNVRELRNAVERASLLSRGQVIDAKGFDFLDDVNGEIPFLNGLLDSDLPTAVSRLERALVQRALIAENGNRSEAAKRLGINRQLLYSKLKDFRLD